MATKAKTRPDAVRVVLLKILITEDRDLIVPGTSGTLLRWETGNGRDTVVIAWDAYMFVGTDQCCSRHCKTDGGFEYPVDVDAIRYIGPTDWTDKPDEEWAAELAHAAEKAAK